MSDVTIGREGTATTDGRMILPNALHWPDLVPVCIRGDEGAWIIGNASVRREKNKIIATVELLPEAMTFDVNADDYEKDGDLLVLKSGMLRTIYIGNGQSPYPKESSDE